MYYYSTLISLIEVVLVLVPALVGIAYITIAERKTLPSVQIIFDFSAHGLETLVKVVNLVKKRWTL
jgi:NADH:ubiquinone oxidoreductase subunit H